MRTAKARTAAWGVALAVSLLAGVAGAEEKKKGGDYEYWFRDDPLGAEANAAAIPQIRVLKIRHSEKLMRPRVAFVVEMLKSVENM